MLPLLRHALICFLSHRLLQSGSGSLLSIPLLTLLILSPFPHPLSVLAGGTLATLRSGLVEAHPTPVGVALLGPAVVLYASGLLAWILRQRCEGASVVVTWASAWVAVAQSPAGRSLNWAARSSLPSTSSDFFDPIRLRLGGVGVSMSVMLLALALAESYAKLAAVLNEAPQAPVQVTPRSEYAPLLTHQTSSSWTATASAIVAATEALPDTAEWQSSSVTGSASDVEAGPTPRWLRSSSATAERSYWLKRYASLRDGLRRAKLSGIQLSAVAVVLFLLLSPLHPSRSLCINDPSIAVACISSVPPSEDRQSAQDSLLHASRVLPSRGAQLIVWPEGALHILDSRAEDELWRAAQSVVNNHGSAVSLSYRLDGPESSATQRSTLLARDATPFVHDKTHLVPFFETSSPSMHPDASVSLHLGSTSISLAIRICHEIAFPSSPAQVLLIPASTSSALLSELVFAQAREAVLESGAAGALICDASPTAFSGAVDASGPVSLRQNDAQTMHRITLPRRNDTRHLHARVAANFSSTGADLAILGAATAMLLAARQARKWKARLEIFAQECFAHWLAMSGAF